MIKMRTETYTARRFKTRAEWLKGRMNSVGASEVAMVLGIAPTSWGSVTDLWERKRNPVIDEGGNDDTLRGSLSESHIRELLGIENSDLEVMDMTGIIFRSKKYPWLTCSLDAAIIKPDGSFIPVEIKSARYTAHWKDGGYPRHYLYQCATQMLVTGAQSSILLARINYDFGLGKNRMERLCAATVRESKWLIPRAKVKGQFAGIIRETQDFWRCVHDGTPPVVKIGR